MNFACRILAGPTGMAPGILQLIETGDLNNRLVHSTDGRVAAACHIGKRQKQEDEVLIFFNPITGALTLIVEDGMGGHKNSDVAARLFKEGARKALQENEGFAETLQAAEIAVLQAAWDDLQKGDGTLSEMGLVYVAARFQVSSQGINFRELGWKGDSRGYLIRPTENRIIPLTRDHSLVSFGYSYEHGTKAPEDPTSMNAEDYYHYMQKKRQGMVLSATKLPKKWDPTQPNEGIESPELLRLPHPLPGDQSLDNQPDDLFLFCSDGALVLPWEQFRQILTSKKPVPEKVIEFRDAAIDAMEGPNRDNLTIVLVENRV